MQFSFAYHKPKVIQALRRHFLTRPEIRIMMVVVNLFAIISAILFAMKKVRPEPFLLGSTVWAFMIVGVYFFLPFTIYNKSATFKDAFTLDLAQHGLTLQSSAGGYVEWEWQQFKTYFESEEFFHLYFTSRSFFLVPKYEMPDSFKHELRGKLKQYISS